ncbi:MAG: MATE family efflux transporter [Cellulosilyticum sp.]|nr:MATE family efflux transporter [Cellulosilyticum sp.]
MKPIDLTKGKVWKVLITLAVPLMGSSLLQFTYNLVDTLFVGRLGSDSVASVGSSSFFIGLGYSLNALVVIGTGIKVAHAIGKREDEEVRGYIHAGIGINFILGVLYMLFLIGFGKGLIGFLDLGSEVIERESYLYLAWSAPMLFFSFFNTLFARILSSSGNTKMPLKISMIGIVLNIILDPILIYGLKWGVVGAAVATLIAQVIMFVAYIHFGKEILALNDWTIIDTQMKGRVKEIFALGFPTAFQRILFTLVNIIMAKMIVTFGTDAIAAQRIGLQIESVVYMVTGGLNGAMASFVGQNYGARKTQRIYRGYQVAIGIGIGYALVSALGFWIFPEMLAECFVSDLNTINITAGYLRIIAYSQFFNAIEMVSTGLFIGIGKPRIPATVSVMFTVLRIPVAWFVIKNLGLEGIWWTISISTILKGSTLYSLYQIKTKKRILSQLGE